MAKKKKQQDWRKGRQDPQVHKKMEYVMLGLTCVSIGSGVGYWYFRSWFWYLPGLACSVAAVVLDIVLPQYFTLISPKNGNKTTAWVLVWPILVHWLVSVLIPAGNWLNKNLFLVVMLISGAAGTLILGLCAEEFRREKGKLAAVFLVAAIFGWLVLGHINEVFDFSEPQSYVLTVEELSRSAGRHHDYECIVTLPDGRRFEIDVTPGTYYALEEGGPVRVEIATGALGIEYANAYPME